MLRGLGNLKPRKEEFSLVRIRRSLAYSRFLPYLHPLNICWLSREQLKFNLKRTEYVCVRRIYNQQEQRARARQNMTLPWISLLLLVEKLWKKEQDPNWVEIWRKASEQNEAQTFEMCDVLSGGEEVEEEEMWGVEYSWVDELNGELSGGEWIGWMYMLTRMKRKRARIERDWGEVVRNDDDDNERLNIPFLLILHGCLIYFTLFNH